MGKARDDISFDSPVDSGVHFKQYVPEYEWFEENCM